MAVATTRKERNDELRARLLNYWHSNFEPKYKLIAKDMNISYINLRAFASDNRNFADENLDKIEQWLNKVGY